MFEASFRVLIPVLVVSGAILITVFDGSEASLKIGLTQLNNQEYSEALEDKLQQHVE